MSGAWLAVQLRKLDKLRLCVFLISECVCGGARVAEAWQGVTALSQKGAGSSQQVRNVFAVVRECSEGFSSVFRRIKNVRVGVHFLLTSDLRYFSVPH